MIVIALVRPQSFESTVYGNFSKLIELALAAAAVEEADGLAQVTT